MQVELQSCLSSSLSSSSMSVESYEQNMSVGALDRTQQQNHTGHKLC